MRPTSLDHVALWVQDRDTMAARLERLGMHVIERSDRFTLLGWDARRGKLTLFAAEGPRERGVLEEVAFRVPGLDGLLEGLAGAVSSERPGEAAFDAGEGLTVVLVESEQGAYDIERVSLLVSDPHQAAAQLLKMGFTSAEPGERGHRVSVGESFVELCHGAAEEAERPLLNHLAVLVESAAAIPALAEEQGLEVESVVDAPNTYAVFLWGPERIRVEYVEHKASFALV